MPTKRGNVYYIKRRMPGLGDVYRSLGTKRKGLARKREEMLMDLASRGNLEPVRAWLDGRADLAEILEARATDGLGGLMTRLAEETVPLEDAVEAVLDAKKADVASSTHQRYTEGLAHLKRFSEERLGSESMVGEVLKTDHVQAFKAWRLKNGAARETVNNDLGAVSILVTYALEKGWIAKRPKVKRFKPITRIRYLEREDVAAYMANLRRPFRPLMQLLIGTGMRLGEAEEVRACDVKSSPQETRVLIEDSKTPEGVRPIFVPRWAAEALREHMETKGLSGVERLFTIPRRTVQKEHNRTRKLAGIAGGYTIHDHRHTAAVHLARAGMPLHLVQQQLGHTKIETTMRYARFHPDYTDVALYFERVGERLGLQPPKDDREDAIAKAAELLGVDPKTLSEALGAISGNTSGNSRGRSETGAET